MGFIRVWCEYDISGSFGGNNNEEVYEVNDNLSAIEIEQLLIDNFADLAEEVECETNLLEENLMGWELVSIQTLE